VKNGSLVSNLDKTERIELNEEECRDVSTLNYDPESEEFTTITKVKISKNKK